MRNRATFLFCGINGTGKSSLMFELIENYVKKTGQKALILVPDFQEYDDIKELTNYNYTGIRKAIFSKELLSDISRNFKNGVLVFDDVRFMIPSNIENLKPFYEILTRRRQKGIDLFFSAHGLTEIPAKLWTYIIYLTLFRTSDNIDRFKRYILKFEQLKNVQFKVNKLSINNIHYSETLKLN